MKKLVLTVLALILALPVFAADQLPTYTGDNGPVEAQPFVLADPDGTGFAEVDGVAGALVTVCMVHRQIHRGLLFEAGYRDLTVADDASASVLIQAAAGQTAHMQFTITAGGDAEVDLYEGPTFSSAGTAVSATNRNRGSSNTAQATITHTPTVSDNGTLLGGGLLVGGTGFITVGSSSSCFHEWILAGGEDYLLVVTNRSGSTQPVGASIVFYEPE